MLLALKLRARLPTCLRFETGCSCAVFLFLKLIIFQMPSATLFLSSCCPYHAILMASGCVQATRAWRSLPGSCYRDIESRSQSLQDSKSSLSFDKHVETFFVLCKSLRGHVEVGLHLLANLDRFPTESSPCAFQIAAGNLAHAFLANNHVFSVAICSLFDCFRAISSLRLRKKTSLAVFNSLALSYAATGPQNASNSPWLKESGVTTRVETDLWQALIPDLSSKVMKL